MNEHEENKETCIMISKVTVAATVVLGAVAIAYILAQPIYTYEDLESLFEIRESERDELFENGFNAGWLSMQDCTAWAIENGAQDLGEAFYWANYYCPEEEVLV